MTESRPEKFALKLAKTNFGTWAFSKPIRLYSLLFCFMVFCHSIYWLTAWWSPWPFIIFNFIAVWFGGGLFKPWGTLIKQAINIQNYDLNILKITIPFVAINWAAVFACLYMFGTLVKNGTPITGTWNYFYYSVLTLTTVGDGNVTPVGAFTEFLVATESLMGFLGFAIIVGIISSIIIKRFE